MASHHLYHRCWVVILVYSDEVTQQSYTDVTVLPVILGEARHWA